MFFFQFFMILFVVVSFTFGCDTNTPSEYSQTIEEPLEEMSSGTDDMSLQMDLLLYIHSVQSFLKKTPQEITEMIQSDQHFYLYTGRATCEWCRKLVPILSRVADEQNVSIYYLDSENTESDKEISDFRNEYNIEFVPSLIYFSGNYDYSIVELNITKIDEEELTTFLQNEFMSSDD